MLSQIPSPNCPNFAGEGGREPAIIFLKKGLSWLGFLGLLGRSCKCWFRTVPSLFARGWDSCDPSIELPYPRMSPLLSYRTGADHRARGVRPSHIAGTVTIR